MTKLSKNMYYKCVSVCAAKDKDNPGLVLTHTPGICFVWLAINTSNMLCSACHLFKDAVQTPFVKVDYKGRPEGDYHNEIVFKAFTNYRGDSGRGEGAYLRLFLSVAENG